MKDGDDPLKALQANVEQIVRNEMKLTNREGAKKFGIAEGSVQNFVAGRDNVTLSNLAQLADKASLPMWQLFLTEMPTDPKTRAEIDRLIRAVLKLKPEDRLQVVRQAEYYRNPPPAPEVESEERRGGGGSRTAREQRAP